MSIDFQGLLEMDHCGEAVLAQQDIGYISSFFFEI